MKPFQANGPMFSVRSPKKCTFSGGMEMPCCWYQVRMSTTACAKSWRLETECNSNQQRAAFCFQRFGERKTSGESTCQWLLQVDLGENVRLLQWPRSAAGFVLRKSSKGPLRRTSLTKNLRRAESWPLAVPADTTPKKQELQNVLGSMNQVESSLV